MSICFVKGNRVVWQSLAHQRGLNFQGRADVLFRTGRDPQISSGRAYCEPRAFLIEGRIGFHIHPIRVAVADTILRTKACVVRGPPSHN